MSKSRAMFAQRSFRRAVETAIENGDITRAITYEEKFNKLSDITGEVINIYDYIEEVEF